MSCLGWARLAAALWAFLFSAGYLRCEVRLTGTFVAQKACPATKKKNTDNPGNIVLEVGATYRLHAKNGEPGTHFHIVVPGAPVTRLRWVEMSCGTAAINRNGGLARRLASASGRPVVLRPTAWRIFLPPAGSRAFVRHAAAAISRNANRRRHAVPMQGNFQSTAFGRTISTTGLSFHAIATMALQFRANPKMTKSHFQRLILLPASATGSQY